MQGFVQIGDRRVGAVDRQGVLDEVVRAQREELELLAEGLERERGGGHFDHAADRHAAIEGLAPVLELFTRARDELQHLIDFTDVRQHGDQDAHGAVLRCPEDGAQLGQEEFRICQAVADRAQTQGRVGLDRRAVVHVDVGGKPRTRRRVEHLVSPHVQGADDDGLAFHGARHLGIGLVLFVLGRQFVAAHEQEFGAEQADAIRTGVQGIAHIAGHFDVGHQFHRDAVQGARQLAAQLAQLRAGGGLVVQALPEEGKRDLIGADDDLASIRVDDEQVAFGNPLAGVCDADNRRKSQTAGEDHGVRGRAAQLGDESGQGHVAVLAEMQHVCRREVVGNQDEAILV